MTTAHPHLAYHCGMFEIPAEVEDSPRRMTQAVLQAAELLGLYNAELARVLGLMCGDIGRLAAARETLATGTPAWQRAVLFLRIFRALYAQQHGDAAAMFHWLRATQPRLGVTPLIAMVDHDGLSEVISCIESHA